MKTGRRSPRWRNFFFRGNSVAAGATLDVCHEGSFLLNTVNDGAHNDNTSMKGADPLNYEVCEQGSRTCFLAFFYCLFLLGHYLRCGFFNHRYVFKMDRNIAAIE